MEIEPIRDAVRRKPFEPFRLKLVSQTELLVRHPEFIGIAPNGQTLVVFGENDAMSILEPSAILSIEILAPRPDDPRPDVITFDRNPT